MLVESSYRCVPPGLKEAFRSLYEELGITRCHRNKHKQIRNFTNYNDLRASAPTSISHVYHPQCPAIYRVSVPYLAMRSIRFGEKMSGKKRKSNVWLADHPKDA